MEFSKITTPSLKELFVRKIEEMILSGKLPIGEKLPSERELAATMQISRAVVNAGISDLEAKGFLIIKPRVGTFVADYRKNGTFQTLVSIMNYNGGMLRRDEVRSILEIRIGLDVLAVKLAIPRIKDDEIDKLYAYVEKIKDADINSKASEAAFGFQHELAFISGNTLIPLIFSSFKPIVITLWIRFCELYGIESLYENTLELYEAIKERNIDEAVRCITNSVNDTISGSRPIYY